MHVGHVAASTHDASPELEPPLEDELELDELLEDDVDEPELDELLDAPLEDVEPPELEPCPELEPELDAEPPELVDELLEDDVDELEAGPELEELEPEAASVTGRRLPSSADDSPSPSPIWARAASLSGARPFTTRNSSPPQAATVRKKIPYAVR